MAKTIPYGEKFYDSFHMRIYDSLLTSSVLQILQVRRVVHEEVFCEDCGASFKTYGNKMLEERKNGRLTVTATAATLGTSAGTAVAKHNFYGKDA